MPIEKSPVVSAAFATSWGYTPRKSASAEIIRLNSILFDEKGFQVIRLREIVLIHDLKRQGLSVSKIARKAGCDRKTVRKYLNRGLEAPVYGSRQPRPRLLDPFEAYLRERMAAFPGLSGSRVLREIRDMPVDRHARMPP